MILTTDEFCQKIIHSECKPQIRFITDVNHETQFGFSVYVNSDEMKERVKGFWNEIDFRSHFINEPQIIRDDLRLRGINVPMMGGYVPTPHYVVGIHRNGFDELPLDFVILIAKVYQEIITQADTFKRCPREELARSVTYSVAKIAEETKLKCRHDVYIHVEEDLSGYTVKLHNFSVYVEYQTLLMTVIFDGRYSSRTVHSLNPILTDLFGLKND